jgi:hypothetical protein
MSIGKTNQTRSAGDDLTAESSSLIKRLRMGICTTPSASLEYQWTPDFGPTVVLMASAADRITALEASLLATCQREAETQRRLDAKVAALEAQLLEEKEANRWAYIQAALDDGKGADPVAEAALHRSFPDVGDGRPMPPMGDELMICGLNEADARFVAVQLANHGLTLRNWRKTAINAMDLAHSDYMTGKGRDPAKYTSQFSMAATALRAIGETSHAAD